MWSILSIIACGPAQETDPSENSDTQLPSEYIYDDTDVIVPDQTPEALAAGVETALERALAFTPGPLFDAYALAMEGQSDNCPNMYADGDAYFWSDQCTSDDGTYFSGYSYAQEGTEYGDEADASYKSFYSAATITNANGYTFNGAGGVYDYVATTEFETSHYWNIRGAFSSDEPSLLDSWLAENANPDIEASVYINSQYPTASLDIRLDGGFSPLSETLVAVSFDDFHWAEWTTCLGEPGGSISLRSEDGLWYDILFDNVIEWDDEQPTTEECDGCGTAYYLGEPVGQVCPNFDVLAEVTP